MESKLPGFTGEKEKPTLAILQEGEWPCSATKEHFQEQGGEAGEVQVKCVSRLFSVSFTLL